MSQPPTAAEVVEELHRIGAVVHAPGATPENIGKALGMRPEHVASMMTTVHEETMDEYVARRCREWDERKAFTPEQWDELRRRTKDRYQQWLAAQSAPGQPVPPDKEPEEPARSPEGARPLSRPTP